MSGIRLKSESQSSALDGQRASGIAKEVYDAAFEHGLIPHTGTNIIKITSPVVINESEIAELVTRMRMALDTVLKQKKASDLAQAVA